MFLSFLFNFFLIVNFLSVAVVCKLAVSRYKQFKIELSEQPEPTGTIASAGPSLHKRSADMRNSSHCAAKRARAETPFQLPRTILIKKRTYIGWVSSVFENFELWIFLHGYLLRVPSISR